MDLDSWWLFFGAALALAFAPGPGMMYVLSRTMSGGKSQGMASTFGTAAGGTFHVLAAALGISALLATSAIAFTVVKWLGAIFFLAFLPQFIEPENGMIFGQILLLGMIVVCLNFIPDFLIVWFSEPVEKLWHSSAKFRLNQQIISGIFLVALGIYLALAGTNKAQQPVPA